MKKEQATAGHGIQAAALARLPDTMQRLQYRIERALMLSERGLSSLGRREAHARDAIQCVTRMLQLASQRDAG